MAAGSGKVYWRETVDGKVPTYNVKDYGAKGDGTTDDSTAINNLITTVSNAGGGTIHFQAGAYSVANSIILKQGVYLTSLAPNHGYGSGTGNRTVRIIATNAIAAGSYVIDTVSGGIASAGGIGIDIAGNSTCGGVRLSRISWGVWSSSHITNCGGSGLWEGGGFACVFEDILTTNCLLTAPTSAVGGAFDIGNTVNSTQGTDHYVTRCELAARGPADSLTSTNLYTAAAAIRGANHFISDSIGETSDVGWYVAAQKTSFSHVRADTNKGHGFWLSQGSNVYTSCRSIGNSQSGTGTYDGFYIESGAWGTKLVDPAVYIAGSIKPRYGINSSTSGGDPVYALQIVNPTVEDSGTARYNLSGYYGVVFPNVALAPSAAATIEVHESSGPYDLTGWAATTVTNFTGGVDGQTIMLLGATTVTIANNATIVTSTAANKTLTGNMYRFTRRNGVWYEDADAAGSGGGATTGIGAAFWHSGTQSIPATTVTQIPLTNTDFNDSTSYYTLASGVITVVKYGLYLIGFYGDAGSDGTAGTRDFFVQVGSGTVAEASTYTNSSEVRVGASKILRIAAGNTLSLNAYFGTAASVYGAAAKDTGISIAYLGG